MKPINSSLFALLLAASASVAHAQEIERHLSEPVDSWSEPNPGVRYLRRTYETPQVEVFAAVIDLSRAHLVATAEDERWSSVSEFAERHGAAVAINGGFWGTWQRPSGITAGGGALWDSSEIDPDFGHFAVRRDGTAAVRAPGEGEDERSLRNVTDALSGRPILLERGEIATEVLDGFATSNLRQPRTAVGVSRDGRTAVLVVVDGRQDQSVGFTLYQLARTLRELGAYRAINLDGGGSSTMYVREAGGIVSSPARGRWMIALGIDEAGAHARTRNTRSGEREVYVRGVEREVMNHLAVIADPPSRVDVAGGDILLDGLPGGRRLLMIPTVAHGTWHFGRIREWAVPAAAIGLPVFALGLAISALRRISSRRGARRAPREAARIACHSSRT
ncbi:MAG: phosphodiester glycosidase family protein [Sandaracinaceae bacterium]